MKALVLLCATTLVLACSNDSGGEDGEGGEGGEGGSAGNEGGQAGSDEGGAGGEASGGGTGGSNAKGGAGGGAKGGTGGSAKGGAGGAATGGSGGTPSGGAGGTAMNAGGAGGASTQACAMPDFTAVIRDFTDKHPDFQPQGAPQGIAMRDAVKPMLDADGKPEWGLPGPFVDDVTMVTIVQGKESFAEWYRDVPGKNMSIEYKLPTMQNPNDLLKIGGEDLRPIDGKLFGDMDVFNSVHPGDAGKNQLWTLELIVEFEYQASGKELMIVGSDDDSWVFINNKLAIDNGGLHALELGNVKFADRAAEFGLEAGKRYKIHFFMAERHLTAGSFIINAIGMKFTNCTPILPKR
jgi:fibro-slime domain-containing protein